MTLKELRLKKKMTRLEVANRTNTTETYILLIETGKRNPSDKMKEKLANVYNVKPITIFSALQQTKCYMINRNKEDIKKE